MTRKTCYKELGAIFVEEVLLKRQGDSNPCFLFIVVYTTS